MKSGVVNFGDISVPAYLIPGAPHDMRPALEHPNSDHERRWKDSVWLRDEGRCRWCMKFEEYTKGIQIHHITYERWGHEEVDDGVCLCVDCHEVVTKVTRALRNTNG
jgi:hypothetical protein